MRKMREEVKEIKDFLNSFLQLFNWQIQKHPRKIAIQPVGSHSKISRFEYQFSKKTNI